MLPLKPGDVLTAAWLNGLLDLAERGVVKIDGGSGMRGYVGRHGSTIAMTYVRPRWVRIVSGGTGGIYTVQEQVPAGVGGWTAGVTFTARAPNGATDLADGTMPYVLAHHNIASDEWTIETPKC